MASAGAMPAEAESVLRVAMTAGDIPDWTGQPDQGFEGYRFVGWSLYDALINWDLSRSDREATLTLGLATKWSIDPTNNRRWFFELRKGVRFHDGCDLTAELVVWNIQRLIDDKTPDSLAPYNLSVWYMISKCAVEKANYDYARYAKAPAGTGPYRFDRVVPHERLELVRNAEYWNAQRVPRHDRLVLIPMPEATTRAAAPQATGIFPRSAPTDWPSCRW
jgi:peptide/nickel transport system substrate-binding protein